MGEPAMIFDLQRARRTDPAVAARRRLSAARRASGLSDAEFAAQLDVATQYRVSARSVATWESGDAVPPGDILVAAEQIAGHIPATEPTRMVTSAEDLAQTMLAVVAGARETLAITGSRSRNPRYLSRIEQALTENPGLQHHRVLYGPLHHGSMRNHLLRLFDLARPADTLMVGISHDHERFVVASEVEAVVILPSVWSPLNFDTALHCTDPVLAAAWAEHVRQAWLGAEPLPDRASIERLEVV